MKDTGRKHRHYNLPFEGVSLLLIEIKLQARITLITKTKTKSNSKMFYLHITTTENLQELCYLFSSVSRLKSCGKKSRNRDKIDRKNVISYEIGHDSVAGNKIVKGNLE